jgi:hypothetical protein
MYYSPFNSSSAIAHCSSLGATPCHPA